MGVGKHALSPPWRYSTKDTGGHFITRQREDLRTIPQFSHRTKEKAWTKPQSWEGAGTRRKATVAETPRERRGVINNDIR